MSINDLPISGPFLVVTTDGKVLHVFDGTGYGDISPDVAIRPVSDLSVRDGFLIVTVR